MISKKFIFLEHTADVKFRAFGKNIEEAFSNSALALKEIMTEKTKIKDKIKKKISVKGKDNESLLYNFL
jgi:SHS2 domain-containing protein